MDHRKIVYSQEGYINDITVDIAISDDVKISDEILNKALMIAMNYLIDNMETTKQEGPE